MEQYLEFKAISKAYPGVQALLDVSFRVEGGKILALLGENGAGKSTLLKILSGDVNQDEGQILVDGVEQRFNSPLGAIKAGVSVIYQERQLIPGMSVMENIFIGEQPKTKIGTIDKRRLTKETQEIIDKFGLPIKPQALVGRLSVAHQQMVEIMKAYRRDSKIIAFDEPTAPLTEVEIEILFDLIMQLKAEGKIILYVSHRLPEIFKITNEIVVLKDGQLVKTFKTSETNEKELITAMVGRDIGDTYANLSRNEKNDTLLLEVNNLKTSFLHDVSFKLHHGEVIGFAGLIGAGRTEIARAIFGLDKVLDGEIILEGDKVKFKEPKDALNAGLALCPEDRKEQGLLLWSSIRENISSTVVSKLSKWGVFFNRGMEEELAHEAVSKYSIKTPSIEKITIELSGGNQQKVILGRVTSKMMATKLLILDEPTKGIDVGTKAEVYQMVCDFAKEGIGVIFISSELTEVINLADVTYVMREGRIAGSFTREEATEEKVLTLAMID